MTYQETEKYIFEKLPMFQNIGGLAYKPTLENTLELCKFLDNPQQNLKYIHVAGTNGKGSVSHSLASIWQTAGYKVGLYTSPHLRTYRERICVNGEMISEQEVIYWVEKLKPKIEEISPSFFEVSTTMAFAHFFTQKVDIVILETGMGGRLDATNIITPILSVITNISYDHQKFLGDTLPLIAGEKAGIIKPNTPVVIGEFHAETLPVFVEKAKKENAPLYKAWENFEVDFLENDKVSIKPENMYFTPALKGIYQRKNLVTIAQVVRLLAKDWNISTAQVKYALENVTNITHLKGRWQILCENPFVVCDTAHNESGFEQLFFKLEKTIYKKKIQHLTMILGFAKDKDYLGILKKIKNNFENLSQKVGYALQIEYLFTSFPLQRALPANQLAQEAENYLGIKQQTESLFFDTVKEALDFAQDFEGEKKKNNFPTNKNKQNTLIFVGGSNFVVAEIPNL